jgi:hypothetical protein
MAREESFFDDLARGLADGSITRGKALRLMGAALIGGTLTSFGVDGVAVADDRCKPTAKKCKKNKQCCSGNCSGGTCAACLSGQVLCNGSCVSNSCSEGQIFDPTSCACVAQCLPNGGTCTPDTQCCSGTICANGKCCTPDSSGPNLNPCTADSECCSGICNNRDDPSYCFSCRENGGSCANGERCCSSNPCSSNGTCCAGPGEGHCYTDADCCSTPCLDTGQCAPL